MIPNVSLIPYECRTSAILLNNCFESIFTADDNHDLPFDYVASCPGGIGELTITEAGVLASLLNLDIKKCCGPDNTANTYLRRYAEWISKYLCLIFNKYLSQTQVPFEWKIGKIIPVHKSGDKTVSSNYRPISLTCTCGILMEHIILKSLSGFVQNRIFYCHDSMNSDGAYLQ